MEPEPVLGRTLSREEVKQYKKEKPIFESNLYHLNTLQLVWSKGREPGGWRGWLDKMALGLLFRNSGIRGHVTR